MTIQTNSLAAGVAVAVNNTQFRPEAFNVPHKILIVGSYDPAKTTIADNEPVRILSPADAGSKFGFGFMIHRLAEQVYKTSLGVETWVVPQPEDGGATQAAGDVDFAGSTGVLSGTVWLYIAGLSASFGVAAADTADNIATKCAAAINADQDLPVTAVVNGVTASQVDITAKSAGTFGNDITIRFNIKAGEELPTGVTAAVTDMTGGATNPDIQDALDALGTDDQANENFFTELVHGYGYETATLDAISTYVGAGNDFIGLYDKLVGRPFRSLCGDIVSGSAGLSALTAIGAGRKLDRANGIIAVPGSANHPQEIAAQALGYMARINNDRAAQHYVGLAFVDVDPGTPANRWTSDYDNRDIAVRSGISPTAVKSGVVVMQNVVTFYHPDSVPVASNGYRSMRNVSILQNLLYNIRLNFEQEKWQGISIVEDTTKVTNTRDRQKARDIDSVKDDLIALARAFESRAWLYTADFTIEKLKESGSVQIRTGTNGFNSILSVILSGEGLILDTEVEFDTSIAVLLA